MRWKKWFFLFHSQQYHTFIPSLPFKAVEWMEYSVILEEKIVPFRFSLLFLPKKGTSQLTQIKETSYSSFSNHLLSIFILLFSHPIQFHLQTAPQLDTSTFFHSLQRVVSSPNEHSSICNSTLLPSPFLIPPSSSSLSIPFRIILPSTFSSLPKNAQNICGVLFRSFSLSFHSFLNYTLNVPLSPTHSPPTIPLWIQFVHTFRHTDFRTNLEEFLEILMRIEDRMENMKGIEE